MLEKLENKITTIIKGCPTRTVFLVALSGGADSMALLVSLCAVAPKEKIFCLHVEHGIRPVNESCGDAQFVINFCKAQEISCRVETIPPGKIASYARRKGLGIEAAARFFRRKALFKEASNLGEDTRILIAHNKDDLLETALMRVLRGAGPAGLCAMPVSRGKILRPLLSVSREEIINYLKAKNISWVEDSTNTDEKFLRNRIRHKLIPLLNEMFPSWKSGVSGMAQTQSLASAFLEKEALQRIIWEQETGNKEFFTEANNFFSQEQIIREEAIFKGINLLLKGKENTSPKRAALRRFCTGAVNAVDLGELKIGQKNGKILLSLAQEIPAESGFSLLINEPGLYNLNNVTIKVCPIAEKEGEKGFLISLPLVFTRCIRGGCIARDDFSETSNHEKAFWVTIRGKDA